MTDTLPRRGTETPATTPRAAAPAASASTVDVGALPVVRLKHWFRWTLAAIIVFALAQFVWSLVTDENYEWDVFAHYFFAPPVLQGAGLTLLFTGLSAAIGFLLGTLIALARLSKSPLLSGAARGCTCGSSARCPSSCSWSSGTTSATCTRRSGSAPRSPPTSGSSSFRPCS